jgi:polyisoprenoid-binding protein YceI
MQLIRTSFYLALTAAPAIACSSGEPRAAFAASESEKQEWIAPSSIRHDAPQGGLAFVLSPEGSVARYRVRERLMGNDLDNDAIGETKTMTGTIAFDAKGKVIPASSRFTLDAGTFVSDKNRRDGYVRGRLLDAKQYPTVVLVPTDVRGISLPLPNAGAGPFEVTADLTVRGVTRPTTWKGSARFEDNRISGTASTAFTFDDIQMPQPRVPVLLSVADTIRLEIDFTLLPQR